MTDVPNDGAILLFVYGTLRDEARMSDLLRERSAWRYLEPATVEGDLYDAGEYPALLLSATNGRSIEGVLVELSDPEAAFDALDTYEDVDSGLFARRTCRARVADGSERLVWVYEYIRSTQALPRMDQQSRSPGSWSYRPKG